MGGMSTTVAESLADYETDQIAAGRSACTVKLRLSYLRRWAATLDDPCVPTLTSIKAFQATPGWAQQTRTCVAGSIRSWLRWAHRSRLFPDLPLVDDVDVPPRPRRRARPLAADVVRDALADADPDVRLMILLGREAGLRRAEIARVHTDDLLPDGILLVHGKGRRQRTVPLSPLLAAALASRDRGWLFDNPVRPGTPMTPSMVGYRIGQALGGRGTAHQLRHTFATTAYNVTHDILTVQELLGHSSVATTQDYLASDPDALRRAVVAASMTAA